MDHLRTFVCGVAVIVCQGCLFGGGAGEADNNAANNVSNNASNNVSNNAPNNASNNETSNSTVEETYGDAEPTSFTCEGSSPVIWFDPSQFDRQPFTQNTRIAVSGPPSEFTLTGLQPLGRMSVAAVSADQESLRVLVGSVEVSDRPEVESLAPVVVGEGEIPTDGEVLDVIVSPSFFVRVEEPLIATATVATSEGVWSCELHAKPCTEGTACDEQDGACGADGFCEVPSVTCAMSEAAVAVGELVDSPSRMDIAPILEFSSGSGKYEFRLDMRFLSVFSGGEEVEALGAVRTTNDDGVEPVALADSVTLTSGPQQIFGERLVWGIETDLYGWPGILLLGDGPNGYGPVFLRASSPAGDYEVGNVDWRLSSRLQPTHDSFTFVDRYTVGNVTSHLGPARFEFSPGDAKVGYIGISDDSESLVFSRPEGFNGVEFLEVEYTALKEVAAYRNIPLDSDAVGEPVIALVHGADRERLALIGWDVTSSIEIVPDVSLGEFDDIRNLSFAQLTSDRGVIGFRASKAGTVVAAGVAIGNASRLATVCP